MLTSMTGYGHGEAVLGGVRITTEIRCVNHRYLDISIRMPREYAVHEAGLREMISSKLRRGRVDAFVNVDASGQRPVEVRVNRELAGKVHAIMREVGRKLKIEGDLDLNALVRIPGVVEIVEKPVDAEQTLPALKRSFSKALSEVEKMRKAEGRAMKADIGSRLENVRSQVARIRSVLPSLAKAARERVRVKMEDVSEVHALDSNRFEQELAYMMMRSDITEELVRLESHLVQLKKTLGSKGPLGKRLDFLVQEVNREVNTIGSKANSADISQEVVEIKSELEKIREQIQNVE